MSKIYVSDTTTTLYKNSNSNSRELVLIFGDELAPVAGETTSRKKVEFRGHPGWVAKKELGEQHPLEMYFVDVGQGDSTFIVTPAGKTVLIDGGRGGEALKFLIWKYKLHVQDPPPLTIDLMVVSHVDADHLEGLTEILRRPEITVKKIVHAGIAKYRKSVHGTSIGKKQTIDDAEYLTTLHDAIGDLNADDLSTDMREWHDAVVADGIADYRAVSSDTGTIDVGDPDIQIEVLGPRLTDLGGQHGRVLKWLDTRSNTTGSKTVNGHSVVLRISYGQVRLLLSGDLNTKGSLHLLEDPDLGEKLNAHVFKAPHHGSDDYHHALLKAVKPQITAVSSGETPDYGHPRASFLGAVGRASRSDDPLLFSTELVALFDVDDETEQAPPMPDEEFASFDVVRAADLGNVRTQFKKRLNGIINVRTDGEDLYAFRRAANISSGWVSYGPTPAAARD